MRLTVPHGLLSLGHRLTRTKLKPKCGLLTRPVLNTASEAGHMTGENPSVDRAIGRIEAKVDRLVDDQDQARLDRRETYKRLDGFERSQEKTAAALQAIDDRLAAVEAPVADFNRWRERGVGAVMLVSFVAASLGGLLVTFGRKIWSVIVG